jgi:hypothetical protein
MCGECTGAAPQQAYRELLNVNPGNNDPSSLFAHVRDGRGDGGEAQQYVRVCREVGDAGGGGREISAPFFDRSGVIP